MPLFKPRKSLKREAAKNPLSEVIWAGNPWVSRADLSHGREFGNKTFFCNAKMSPNDPEDLLSFDVGGSRGETGNTIGLIVPPTSWSGKMCEYLQAHGIEGTVLSCGQDTT